MLRDKNLIPLSHQHQHALALCVRIERASPIPQLNLPAWQEEIVLLFRAEIGIHFAAEEEIVFPAARNFPELVFLIDELLTEHTSMRRTFSQAQRSQLSAEELSRLAQQLSAHIRKEERQLFERIQKLMDAAELAQLGEKLERALKDADPACLLPNEATRLRPTK